MSSKEVTLSNEHTEHAWKTKPEFLELNATEYLKNFVQETLVI